MTSLRQDAVRGVLWTTAERWLVRLAGLVTFAVLGRLLEPRDFGLVSLAAVFMTVLGVLSELGFSTWLIQAPDVDDRDTSTAFWISIGAGTVLAGGLFAAAPLVATLFDAPDLAPVLRAFSSLLVLTGLSSVPTALLARRMQFRMMAICHVISIIAGSASGITLAVAGAGVWALVGQAVAQQVVGVVALAVAVRWRPRLRWSWAAAREMTTFGTRVIGIQLVTLARDHGESFLIGAILGVTALGYWSVASRLYHVLLDVGLSVISAVATPTFVRLRGDGERLARAYQTSLAVSAVVVGPALTALAVLSPQLVPLVFGAQWRPSAIVAVALAIGGLAAINNFFDRAVFLACDRLDAELRLAVLSTVVHMGLIVAIGHRGLLPLAIALAAGRYAIWPVRVVILRRRCGIPPSVQWPAVVVLSACVAGGLVTAIVTGLVPLGAGWTALAWRGAMLLPLLGLALLLTSRDLIHGLLRDVRGLRGPATAPPVAGTDEADATEDDPDDDAGPVPAAVDRARQETRS